MKWIAGSVVVLAAAIVAGAVILAHRPQRPVLVNLDGQLTVCNTQSLTYGDTCR
ncbi:MAG TPA: hypothetical protein VFU51_04005 [Gaiellaceae bacterium]|nr:hypothetical protein [Gaiellaceae bacterium]